MSTGSKPLLAEAIALQQRGQWDAAAAACLSHLAHQLDDPDALHLLGLVRQQQRRSAEAATLIARAIAAGAAGALPRANLAAVRLALGDDAAAAAAAREALALDRRHFGAWLNLALALERLGQRDAARAALVEALALRPADARANAALGRVLDADGDDAALAPLARALAADPSDVDSAFRLGRLHYRRGQLAAAIAVLAEVATRSDAPRDAALLLAVAQLDRGEPRRSIAVSDALLARAPEYAEARSNRLIALQHCPGIGAEALFEAHLDWARRHAAVTRRSVPRRSRAAGEPLRLGLVSPRFVTGPVPTFLAPLLAARDPSRIRCELIAVGSARDAESARLAALADAWHDAAALDDDGLAALLRERGIDVAIDLSGHAPGNRLSAFARGLAPLQLVWLDYFCTTGLTAFDAFLSDAVLTPRDSPQRYAEMRLVRLAAGRLCYEPPAGAPPVAARAAGPLRFASFNRLAKLNAEVAAAWSAILRAVPGSVLRLRGSAYADAETRAFVLRERFEPHGIGAERLEFDAFGSHLEALERYGEVDVALDPFPFSGCATSCDALWMGVPVVTLAGETLVGRQSASLLASLGLDGLIADSVAGYIDAAVRLAADAPRRAALRASLRERARQGFADRSRFARAFEDAIETLWRESG